MLELVDTVLHQTVGGKGKHTHSWHGVGSPMSVKVHIYSVVEHTVSTLDGVSLDSFSEISRFFWQALQLIDWSSRIAFVKAQE